MKKIILICEFGCDYELAKKVVVLRSQDAQRTIAEWGLFSDFNSLEQYLKKNKICLLSDDSILKQIIDPNGA